MQTGKEKLKAYESIIQNLSALKDEEIQIRPSEAEAIEGILQSLSDLRNDLHNSDVLLVSSIPQANSADTALDKGRGNILVHTN